MVKLYGEAVAGGRVDPDLGNEIDGIDPHPPTRGFEEWGVKEDGHRGEPHRSPPSLFKGPVVTESLKLLKIDDLTYFLLAPSDTPHY